MRSSRGARLSRWSLVPLFAVVGLFAVMIAISLYWLTFTPLSYRPPYYGWWFGGFPFFPWFLLIPLFFVIFFGLRWFFCLPLGRNWYPGYRDHAMDTLRQRFAKGEITKQQFEQMRDDLEGGD